MFRQMNELVNVVFSGGDDQQKGEVQDIEGDDQS